MEDVLLPVRLVRDARVVAEAAGDLHLIRLEPGLHPEGAPGAALAGEAVADGDGERLARDLQAKLPAVTGGLPRGHSRNGSLSPVQRLTKAQARRIAVRAQLLDSSRPTDLLAVVDRLTMLQVDPTAAIAPSADLVLWSRLGSSYRPEELKHALEHDRTLFELDAMVRPVGDLGLYLAGADAFPDYESSRVWFRDNDRFRRDILELLKKSGPLTSRGIPDTCVVPWALSGWTNNRNVTQMLEFLMMRGEVAIAGRVGRERLWDLPDRVYPTAEVPPAEEAERRKDERRLASLGIARAKARKMPN